ncbi:MAG TPA: DUF1003 domain-containing protein, partial [Actinoplanes sp.]|nr:DUF1003 domain-containing protein [Actinoplanes sp.]
MVIVVLWIAAEIIAVVHRWDSYPFILVDLRFSTHAAYAAGLILLSQIRQADTDPPRGLTADTSAAALRRIRRRACARTLRQAAVELLSEVRRVDRRIAEATATRR